MQSNQVWKRGLAIATMLWAMAMIPGLMGVAQAQDATANSRYVIQGDSVYDQETDLTWSRCSVGQNWKDGIGCEGAVKAYSFVRAQHLANKTWRIPKKDELATLIDLERKNTGMSPTIDVAAFPDMDPGKNWYWSSTVAGAAISWSVGFDGGYVNDYNRNKLAAVRLVRSGR
jgi:hypothetical protein